MSLRFYNIVTGQELTAETEPQIAALWGSSDRSPNVSQGQDMGWRFAPEVLAEMRDIMEDPAKIQQIADRFRKLYEDVSESDVMTWISSKTNPQNAPVATREDYKDDYDLAVRRAEAARKAKKEEEAEKASAPTTTAETTESLADMRERAELAERIAKAESGQVETTTAPATTTSTTTKK